MGDARCVRCGTTFESGGVRFKRRTYCDECIELFEEIAEQGVVVRSRHGKPNFDEKPYLVDGGGKQYVEHSQVEALARGRELADRLDVRGLFIYWKHGSHWLLETYLEEHPDIRSQVADERRIIRGETPIDTTDPDGDSLRRAVDIRAAGDAIVDSTVVDDSVVNRSSLGDRDES